MLYSIRHKTTYVYEQTVLQGQHLAHLRPRNTSRQRLDAFTLDVSPPAANLSTSTDYFGNFEDYFEIPAPHQQLEVTALATAEVLPAKVGAPNSAAELPWERVAKRLVEEPNLLEQREYCFDSPLVRGHFTLKSYALTTFSPGRPLRDAIVEFNQRIYKEFSYDTTVTDVATPLAQVLREKRGVCQDFAHLAVGCLRSLGLAARYVSGYLLTRPPPGKPRLIGADASHAWASAFIPEAGWFDFDPTNNVLPGEQHITVAWGRDFSDVSPLRGVVLGNGSHQIRVGVDVQPVSGPDG